MHPIQEEMLRLEHAVGENPKDEVPVDEVIAGLIDFKGDIDKELDPILLAETKRAVRLASDHYANYSNMTPLTVASIAFLQGVTFARAAMNINVR